MSAAPSGSPVLTVIYWRDIPAQVTATDGERTARVQLPDRFQHAIDAAAVKAGLVDSDAYLEEWHRETRPCGGDLEREAATEAERLDVTHPQGELRALVRSGGRRTAEDQQFPG
jgi:Virulence factor